MPLSPETAALGATQSKSKIQPPDSYQSKLFDPKKLVCQLDAKLKRIQMISDAADFEISGSVHSKHRRAKQEDQSNRGTYKYKDALLAHDKKGAANRRQAPKGGLKSYGSSIRDPGGKVDPERSGATSPDYNIYSDSELMGSDNDQTSQKEGGSAEESQDGKIYGNPAAGASAEARPRQSENRLVQNGGNIVHQKPAVVKRRVVGMVNDLNPVRSADEVEEENKIKLRKALEAQKPPEPVKLTQQQLFEFQKKRFERPQFGKYTQIFPFSEESERLAIALNKQCSTTGGSVMGGPNSMKQLVVEIKQYYDEKAAHL